MNSATGYAAGRHAVPDEPVPVAGRARRRVALPPAEALGAAAQAFLQAVARPAVAVRIAWRVVPHPQLHRVDAELVGELVHGASRETNEPVDSPGPRVNVGVIVLPWMSRWTPWKFSHA